jgi:hypothetical protein
MYHGSRHHYIGQPYADYAEEYSTPRQHGAVVVVVVQQHTVTAPSPTCTHTAVPCHNETATTSRCVCVSQRLQLHVTWLHARSEYRLAGSERAISKCKSQEQAMLATSAAQPLPESAIADGQRSQQLQWFVEIFEAEFMAELRFLDDIARGNAKEVCPFFFL